MNVQYFITSTMKHHWLNFLFPTVHGLPLSTSNQEYGNNMQLPLRQNLSKIQNDSRLHINITSNELSREAIHTSTRFIKTPTTNLPVTHTAGGMLGGFEKNSTNFPTVATTVGNLRDTEKTTLLILTENYTTASPSASTVVHNHHFNIKILNYILIPIGCLLAIVVLCCVVSPSQLYLNTTVEKFLHILKCILLFPHIFTQQIAYNCAIENYVWKIIRYIWTAEKDMKASKIVA